MADAVLPVCLVNVRLYGQDGIPKEGARVTAKLKAFDLYSGYVIPEETAVVTDVDGFCVLPLWPNELGATETSYEIKIVGTNGKRITLTTVVPNLTEAELHNISTLPLFPGKVDGQVPLEAAIEAGTIATQAQIVASAAAVTALEAQAVAEASRDVVVAAEIVVVAAEANAIAQATHATTMAGQSSGSATAAAASETAAAASAATATTQAGIAVAAATNINVTAVGQDLLGANTIGAVAAVASAVTQVAAVDDEVVVVAANEAAIATVAGNIDNINAASENIPHLSEKANLTGAIFTGPVEVPAGASGAQAPQAQEVGSLAVAQRVDLYRRGNALGAVSQSGGVPTGALIESGSNANGDYIRFADGHQICSRTITTSATTGVGWTFPAAFAAAPAVAYIGGSPTVPVLATYSNLLSTSLELHGWSISGARQAASNTVIAFGRWF